MIINAKLLKYLPEHVGQIKSLFIRRQNLTNIADLQYLPKQLTADTLELTSEVLRPGNTREAVENLTKSGKSIAQISEELNLSTATIAYHLKKMGLYTPKRKGVASLDIIDKNILENLVNTKKSLTEIADELNVSIGKVKYYLEKYDIKIAELEELEILRKYFSATTKKDKSEAFAVIDKYLEKIAKEKYHQGSAISYQDFLQDVRLQFLELAEKRENNINSSVRNLFRRIREIDFTNKVEVKTEGLTSVLNKADDTNVLVANFEDADFFDFLLKNSNLTCRHEHIIDAYTKQNRSLIDIADELGLTPQRVKTLLDIAIEKIDKSRAFYSSDKYIELRAHKTQRIVQELAKHDRNSQHIKVDNNYNYYC